MTGTSVPPPSAADLDAVTVDAHGTLLALADPTERLRAALAARGVERELDEVAAAFRAEASHYRPRSHLGADPASLAALRAECVAVFLEHLRASLAIADFVPAFVDAMVFEPAEGAVAALDALRAAGLVLACVANWDVSLHEQLARLGVHDRFACVLTSAEAGAEKPDPRVFRLALERLGVPAARALHIGDDRVDEEGASAAGLAFAPVPLATLPARLGL